MNVLCMPQSLDQYSHPLTHHVPPFAGSVSHETRQFIHLKVDTYHIVLWKSKDTPFHVTD
jgi:hypothetical protein